MDPSDQNQIEVTVTKHVDRISTLPDDVITNSILSLLPTRDSVRTSALSTRWKHLYASVPILDFECNSDRSFVDVVVKLVNSVKRKQSRVSKLRIHVPHMDVFFATSWIDHFTSRSIEQLDLYGFWIGSEPTPHSLFICETLVSLRLAARYVLSVPKLVCLPKLKELVLELISVDESNDQSVRRLFSSCPVLEILKLAPSRGSMNNARVFNVSVPSLKALSLCMSCSKIEVIINCPNLEELNYEDFGWGGYSGDVFWALKKCYISVYLPESKRREGKTIELLRQVSKVQFLSLHGGSMQALLIPLGSLPNFENLTHLELESSFSDGWQLLPSILDSSPRLSSLVFANGFVDLRGRSGNPFPPSEHIPVCLSFHLRMIRIGRFHGIKEEYKWVEYFLTNALVLKKMEICLCSSEGSDEENDPNVEGKGEGEREGEREGDSRLDKMSKRLLNFQRSSQICQIILALSD